MDNLFNSILVVDNMPDVLACTELFFQISGFEVHTAGRAKEAVELYKTLQKAHRTPQVVVADGALGLGDDGFTLLAKIKDLDRQNRTTTFIYTAHGMDRARLLAIGSGAESIIDKMKVGDALLGEINNGLRNKARRASETVRTAGQSGFLNFNPKEAVIALVMLIWMAVTLVEMTYRSNQMSQIIKIQTDSVSHQVRQDMLIQDTRDVLLANGMIKKKTETKGEPGEQSSSAPTVR